MHYILGPTDSPSSPSFTLPAAPPPPSIPIGSTSTTTTDGSSGSATHIPVRQLKPSTPAPRSTFPSPPSHPNPAFASVLKRDAASASSAQRTKIGYGDLAEQVDGGEEDCTARAASVAGPSTQPETAFAATSTSTTVAAAATAGSKLVRLDQDGKSSVDGGEEEDYTHSVSERIRETMAEHSAVISTFIAGGLAGAASRTVVSPLERLKIILQVQTAPQAVGASTSGQAYGAMWPSLVRMWKEEGFRGFMKGNGINVVRILPYSAIQFTSYGYAKKLFARWSGTEQLSTPLRLAAGASAGILAVSATYPLDLVRARLSIATANMARSSGSHGFTAEDAKLGIAGMTRKVYRTEGGIKGLYRGCWATAVGVAPYVSLNFYIYETLRPLILPPDYHPSSEVELVGRKLLSGAVAGGTSLLFTHPFDVVRRKLQVVGIGGGEREYEGAIDCIRKISRKEGFWRGMYRGLTPNIIKVAPSIAVSFYTFETVKDALTNLTQGTEERSM